MTDETQVQIPQPVEPPQRSPEIMPPSLRKSNKMPWIIAGIIGVFICLCCAACLALTVSGVGRILLEKAPVEAVLKSFMEDMQAKDVEAAYGLFSPRSKQTTPLTDLKNMLEGNNYILFDGYENLTVQNLNFSAAINTNPEMPRGRWPTSPE